MEELHYLEEHSPDTAKKVRQMMAERKQIEALMKKAKTKSQAMLSAALVMNNVNKSTNNPIEANLRLKHLKDVVSEYEKSAEFRAKADIELELAKNPSDKLHREAEKAENKNANQTEQITENANAQQDMQDVQNTQNLLGQSENTENTAQTEKKSDSQSYDKKTERSEIEKEEKTDKQKDEKIKRYKSQHSKINMDFKV